MDKNWFKKIKENMLAKGSHALSARIAKFYKEKSIQYTLSLSFTAIALIGIIFIGTALLTRFSALNANIAAEYNRRIVEQVNLNLDSYLRSMMQISNSMYYSVIKNADLSIDSIDKEMNLLYETNRDFLISIAVFNEKGNLVTATPLSGLKKTVSPSKEQWFKDALRQIENLHFSTPHVQNLFEDAAYKYKWVVSLSRAVELTHNGSIQGGVLLVDMNFSGIEQICKNVNLGKLGYLYLTDRNGEIVYHPRQQLIYSNLLEENHYSAASHEDGSYTEQFQGEKRVITVKTLGYTGWRIVAVTPMEDIDANSAQVRFFVIFIIVLTILLLILANAFLSAKIADPIQALEHSVKQLEDGNQNVEIAIGGSYEIQHLGKTIRSMVRQMHKLMRNIVVEQELKRKSEWDALQAQINPHFLYNTLDSIVWMVENERYKEAIIMVKSLAGFFRAGLSKGKNIITVENELTHARSYITIQQMRFKDKFEFKINVQPQVLHMTTIKLIIQPIIENAIYHGMEFMDGDGEITVNAYIQNGDMYIDVIDNGLGIPEEIAKTLLTHTARAKGAGSGIGLRNVQERVQLYFGEDYGLTILSVPDEGTNVRIHLPCVDYSEVEKGGGKL